MSSRPNPSKSKRRVSRRRKGGPSRLEIDALLALANAGRYLDAESLARSMTRRFPQHGFGWKGLGAVLKQMGRADEALMPMRQAAALLPGDAEAHNSLGVVLKNLGRFDDAVSGYHRALELNPDFADAHNNLGVALQELGLVAEAVTSYGRALRTQPGYADAHHNLGNALTELGSLDQAVASYRRALGLKPALAVAHRQLGVVGQEMGRPDDAVACYRRALQLEPGDAKAHNNLGVALTELGRPDEAVASCRKALAIKPDHVKAHNNLGAALLDLGRFAAATASFRRALALKPEHVAAQINLGNALKDLGFLADALVGYRRALELEPDCGEAHNNLGLALTDLGRLDEAVAAYRRALELEPDFLEAHNNLLFTGNYLPDQPPQQLLSAVERFGAAVARRAHPYAAWPNVADGDRCLQVGLVSGDLRNHPVGYFVDGCIAAIAAAASERMQLFAYPSHPCTDPLAERIKSHCHAWQPAVGLSDERLAAQIRSDRIDILIDLSGHTRHNRLAMFAWRPAPVLVTWLGYFATTGVAAMDYLIADPWTLVASEEANFTERIWRMPETRLCFARPDVEIGVEPLPALRAGQPTFGCFNNLTKMNDQVVALWARVLASVPGSRLFLKAKQLNDVSVRLHTMQRFGNQGISADRLVLEGHEPRRNFLSAYHRVDIALDPFPFSGATTTVESLWMGVPVLTLAGNRMVSRQGVSILMNAGLADWIASDTEDYVARAIAHAADLQRLSRLRSTLRQQVLASPLFDASRFAENFEAALRGMWRKWCEEQAIGGKLGPA